jgi:diguanylate cyclase (GGDEF)-like protein/PAS domain S-box-containing protein
MLSLQSERQVRAEAERALGLLTSGVFILIAVAALTLGYVAEHVVMRRLGRLAAQVDAVASGTSSGPVFVAGDDEISSLARHIDSMVEAQAVSREELTCAQAVLEERVEARTEEIRAAVGSLKEEIEERQRTEEALFESERRFRGLVDSLFDAVITMDEGGTVLFANAAVASVFGQQPASVVGSSLSELFDAASARQLIQRLARGVSAPVNDLSLKTRDIGGASNDVDITLTPSLGPLGVVQGIVRDVTTRRRYESELLHMASHDFLTGLCNRRRFEEEVERAVAQSLRRESPGAILWFDLDYFKEVNDTLGHRAGDELLVHVAETLSRTVRSESLLARLGGDEFALLLYQADAVEARHAAERVLSEIKNLPFSVGGNVVRTSASVGVVLFPEHGVEVEELLTRADVAMYRAKEMGRSRWVIYSGDEDWRDDMHRRRSWADRIQRALGEGGLVAHAQPVVNVTDGSVCAFELLVRLREEDGTLVAPDAFLGAAERVGLIRDVDVWMVREAIALLAEYTSEQLRLEVNLSAQTFADPSFFIEVGEMLRRAGVSPERLGIEITERAVMSDITRVQDSLRIIKQVGCRLSLDDFGSGFSAFYHLKHLPLDDVKIDGDFIGRLPESIADQHLVRAIVEMARGMGMFTTAEFVQSEGVMDLLREYGVDHAQGFGVAEPGPAVEVIERALRPSITPPARISAAS